MSLVRNAALAVVLLAAASAGAEAQWTEIGPSTSDLHSLHHNAAAGGRVNGLAAAPDKSAFYAATEWGGVYKSVDGGQTWKHVTSHVPLATWRIAVDPSAPSRVYATSFYDGRVASASGINVSNDAGATWAHVALPALSTSLCPATAQAEASAFGIAFDPVNSAHVYIGTNCGLVRTLDGGATWSYVYPNTPGTDGRVWSVIVHDGMIDICGQPGHRRSTDGGATWSSSGMGIVSARCSLVAAPGTPNTLFAVAGENLYVTVDGGTIWNFMPAPDAGQAARIPMLMLNPRSGSKFDLWFGYKNLYASHCGDVSSLPAAIACAQKLGVFVGSGVSDYGYGAGAHQDAGILLFDPSVGVDACPLLYANDGGIESNTSVAGANCQEVAWSPVSHGPHALWVTSISGYSWLNPWTVPGVITHDLVFSTQDNGLFSGISFGGATPDWHNVDPSDASDVVVTSAYVASSVCCWVLDKHLFVRSRGAPGSGFIPPAFPWKLMDGSQTVASYNARGYALMTKTGLVLASDLVTYPTVGWNMGWPGPWLLKPKVGSVQLARSPFGDLRAFAKYTWILSGSPPLIASQVWTHSTIGGPWALIHPPFPGSFTQFAVDPVNPKRMIGAFVSAAGVPGMFMSGNGGMLWNAMPALDNCMTRAGRIRYTTTAGPTAGTATSASFDGYSQPTLVAFDSGTPYVVAAGADGGLFLSIDGGVNWRALTDPFTPDVSGIPHLGRVRAVYFAHASGQTDLFVGTQGRGVWRLPLGAGWPGVATAC